VRHAAFPDGVTREDLVRWYRRGRALSEKVFSIPVAEAYYDRPIPLRNPIVFYEGHIPAFAVNTIIKLGLKCRGINEQYETLFARGIDPESVDAMKPAPDVWPSREEVRAYAASADAMIEEALLKAPIDDGREPQRVNAEAAFAVLEHEEMHQETLLYMFHEMDVARKRLWSAAPRRRFQGGGSAAALQGVPAGLVTLGSEGWFGWDNEFPAHRVEVNDFTIDRNNVTNGEYLEYMNATGAPAPHFWTGRDGAWHWRGLFETIPLPLDWPAWVTHDEASAYARWRGARLPSEAEYHRAAFGTPSGDERMYPWGNEPPDATRGNFGFANFDPVPVGSYPAGASAWGVNDLVGNGWEWTSTIFDGFDGFKPMASYPEYSADFFDRKHYVMKGASPATGHELIRRSFRNWFRPSYPYVYASFRLCSGGL
jgi:gamma-glutamyl hercynylcysteine S-oxide synthase